MKYDRRLVARNILADLEAQVRFLQSQSPPWELDREAQCITLVEAFDAIDARKMVVVAMKREVQPGYQPHISEVQ